MTKIADVLARDGTFRAVLRLADRTDAPSIVEVINRVAAERVHLVINSFTPAGSWEKVLNAPDAHPDHLLMVAEADRCIVGWCRVFPWGFGHKSPHVADLGIGILRPYRLQGIGTALVEQAIIWAGGRSYEKLTLSTYVTNQVAIHVFTKVGFETTGVRRKQYKLDGQYVDELLMERFLGHQ